MSRVLVLIGVVLIAFGLLWPWLGQIGLGRLPGDILIQREHFTFYAPIATGLLISLVLQALLVPLTLGGLDGSRSIGSALNLSPVLSVLWALGAVILPLIAAGLALPTCRLRSFMSTTGLLYLAMIAILPGQLLGQLLLFVVASA